MEGYLIVGGLLLAVLVVVAHHRRVRSQRRRWRKERLSEEERRIVSRRFPLWDRIPEEVRRETEGWMRVMMAEKNFEACGDLEEVTPEMKLAIAAPACLLIARRPQDYYERLKSILVYPDVFTARDEWGEEDPRLGESWGTGSVVLSWASVKQGDLNPEDGLNVVMHEFAHQLDQSNGAADGYPDLDEDEDAGRWSEAFRESFTKFRERVERGERTVLDDYGAENPAEFFAVATETFFERAEEMKEEEPEIYEELAKFYGMDPSEW